MTSEQIIEKITEEVMSHPELAEEYKKQILTLMKLESRFTPHRSAKFDDMIKKIEGKSAEEVLVDEIVRIDEFFLKTLTDSIETFKNPTDEDLYIAGLFNDNGKYETKKIFDEILEYYSSTIKDTSDKKFKKSLYKEYIGICNFYDKGLEKRAQYIKEGEERYRTLLSGYEETLASYSVVKSAQRVINYAISRSKFLSRSLAERSVVDAFKQIGTEIPPKEDERIQEVIELHDPKTIEKAIKNLTENPTENMIKLEEEIKTNQSLEQHKKSSKLKKVTRLMELFAGGMATSSGVNILINSLESGNTSSTVLGAIIVAAGVVAIGAGTRSYIYGIKEQNPVNKINSLITACVDDFFNEVTNIEVAESKDFWYGKNKGE